jgi:glucose-1-phosphatase
LGGVFIDFDPAKTVRRLKPKCVGSTENEITDVLFRSGFTEAYERGAIDSDVYLAEVRRRLRAEISDEEFREAWQDVFSLIRPMAELLPEFSGRWRLGMISNTNAMHIERIRRDYDLFRFFDPLIFSHEVGLVKPEEAIYRLAIEKTGVQAEECVFVDDTPGHVEAAVRLGMKGIVFRDKETFLEDFRFYDTI